MTGCVQFQGSGPARLTVHPRALARGFGLLEALVAMAIASVALGTLYRVVGQGAKTSVDTELRVQAMLVARSVLAEGTFAEDFSNRGHGRNGDWDWTVSVVRTPADLRDADGRDTAAPVMVGRVTVSIARLSAVGPVFSFTAWKPYRAAS